MIIHIDEGITDESYFKLKTRWESSDDAEIRFSALGGDEFKKVFYVLTCHVEDDFADSLLHDLFELDSAPRDLFHKALELGVKGCALSICLRKDLTPELIRRCLSTADLEVLEHAVFNDLVTTDDCKELLLTPLGYKAKDAINRAIKHKSNKQAK